MKIFVAGGILWLAIVPSPLASITNSWIGTGAGKWEDATKWSLGLAPAITQTIFLTNANSKTVTIDATTTNSAPGAMTVSNLILSAPFGNANTLTFSGLSPMSPFQVFNTMELRTGGVLNLHIPDASGAIVVDQTAASGGASNDLSIGYNTQGNMRMNGGTILQWTTIVGFNAGSTGTLTVEGGTNALGDLVLANLPGSTGTVWITSGSRVSSGFIYVGGGNFFLPAPGGTGQCTISNASVSAHSLVVGGYYPLVSGACGTLTIAGGTLEVGYYNGYLCYIGVTGADTGAVWLTDGGRLIVTNSNIGFPATITIGNISGGQAKGSLTVSHGFVLARSITAQDQLTLAGGTISLSDSLLCTRRTTWVAGGALFVTNSAATAFLAVSSSGSIMQTGGFITADLLTLRQPSQYSFFSGTLATKGTAISNGLSFVVGDGTNTATFTLNGGFHLFTNGLVIAQNSWLTGCGTISGTVSNQGTIALTCPTVFSNGFVNSATLIVSNGASVDFYGPVINNGLINAITGTVNFHSTFVNNGTYLDANGDADGDGLSNYQEYLAGTDPTNSASAFRILSVSPIGNDILIAWQAGGGRTNIVQVAADPGGSYTNIGPNLLLPGSGDIFTNYLDSGGATNAPPRFYRIQLVP